MNTRNLTVDTLRLLAALEIIVLHRTFESLPALVAIALRLQARWAVPFFFIVGGYFLARRLANPARADVRPTIYRLLWIFALWSLIYIPLVLYQHDLREVFRRLLFPSVVYVGTYFHLWFPSALIFGLIVLTFCFYYRLDRWLPLIAVLIFANALLSRSYDIFGIRFPFDFETARHWTSIPFLYMGVWLYRRGPLNVPVSAGLAVGGLLLQALEAYLLLTRFGMSAQDHEVLLGTIPYALGMASLGLCGLRWLEQPVLARWGKDYSLGIYLIHPLAAFALGFLAVPLSAGTVLPVLSELLSVLLVAVMCIGFFAAVRRWLPRVSDWLFGTHPEQP